MRQYSEYEFIRKYIDVTEMHSELREMMDSEVLELAKQCSVGFTLYSILEDMKRYYGTSIMSDISRKYAMKSIRTLIDVNDNFRKQTKDVKPIDIVETLKFLIKNKMYCLMYDYVDGLYVKQYNGVSDILFAEMQNGRFDIRDHLKEDPNVLISINKISEFHVLHSKLKK